MRITPDRAFCNINDATRQKSLFRGVAWVPEVRVNPDSRSFQSVTTRKPGLCNRILNRALVLAALAAFGSSQGLILVAHSVEILSTKTHSSNSRQSNHDGAAGSPRDVTYAEAASGEYRDSLVSMTGVLVSQVRDANSSTLIINSESRLVRGYLEQNAPIGDYQVGSRLRISGICKIIPANSVRPAYFSHIEIRSAADVQLISKASWLTFQHLLDLLFVISTIALAVTIRAAFLKWRSVNQTAWIDRSMIVARERSRILEMISSNYPLSELLDEICNSTMKLLPGSACSYTLQFDNDFHEPEGKSEPNEPNETFEPPGKPVFEFALKDNEERVTGKIVVSSTNSQPLAADREEIYAALSELSSLAMRQSLLYRGLVYHSTHDPLTQLPNRRLYESQLASAISEAKVRGGQLAVIYLDINRFKYVNDKHGHRTGDLYLQQISNRLRSQLRPMDMLARIGGDEFVVIAPFPEAYDRAYALTMRLERCFEEPFELEGKTVDGSASFGFARYPEHGLTAEELTRHADHEMYICKHEVRISEEAHAIATITADELELALLAGRFRLAYQPQFSATGRFTGLETLLRLDDPVLGLLTPEAFISVAERHPVIVGIGAWALRGALQDANRWKLNTGEEVTIAVNVSVRQLEEPGYANSVLECLQENNFPPERLEIELIERSLIFSGDKVIQQLERLRNAGVRISLDDFGTEQSCLSLLHKLPIDTIKLDRSFIRAMDSEPGVFPIIQAIVSMAHSLGKRVVAEAIEHVGPVPALLKMGKMDFQGYLLSRPVPAEEVHIHIEKWRAGIVMPEAFRESNWGGLRRIS